MSGDQLAADYLARETVLDQLPAAAAADGAAATREAVEEWLLAYAWLGSREDRAAEVACIMAQDGWQFVDVGAEQFAGAQEQGGRQAVLDGYGFALSALYECHDAPHTDQCPRGRAS